MKKILSILLTALVLLTIAVSCAQDVTVDAQLYNNVDTDVFMLNGKYYATLQEAVNARLGKGAKAAGDNDDVIYLRKNAAGPGAVINDPNTPVVIDFAGCTYSFTDVTATQGSTTGTFGLSISGGSEVTLKGTSTMTLFDSTANLTMVYVSGSNSSLVIEDSPKMEVKENQYVFWATDGATLTIGGETTMTGGLAATGTEEKVPRVIISTTEESSISTLKIAAATVEPTGGNVKVASLKASDNAIISASGDAGITITSDDSGDSSYSIQNTGGGEVKNEDATINHGEAQKTTDGTKTTEAASVARIGTQNYSTIASAIEAGDGKKIVLLADITESPIATESRTITADLNGKNVGSDGSKVAFITTSGSLIVENTSQAIGSVFINATDSVITDLTLYGGYYNLDVSAYVAEGYVARKTGDVWTVSKADEEVEVGGVKMSLVDFAKSVNSGIDYEGATVTLLKDVDLSGITWTPIGAGSRKPYASDPTANPLYGGAVFKGEFDGNGKTITGLSNANYEPTIYGEDKSGTNVTAYQYVYGLFGITSGADIHDLTLKDVNITKPAVRPTHNNLGVYMDSVGALIGYSIGSLTVDKVSVTGTSVVQGDDGVGGIVGRSYNKDGAIANKTIVLTNCSNAAAVTGGNDSSDKAAGLFGYISDNSVTDWNYSLTITGNSNSGTVSGTFNSEIAVLDQTMFNYNSNGFFDDTRRSSITGYTVSGNTGNAGEINSTRGNNESSSGNTVALLVAYNEPK